MSKKDLRERAVMYNNIINELVEKYPLVSGRVDVGLTDTCIVDVHFRVTTGYARWLSLEGEDVSDVQYNNQGTVFAPGKHAVQFLLMQNVHIVRQLLEKGVDPDVAIKLLPYELASAVHREYVNQAT